MGKYAHPTETRSSLRDCWYREDSDFPTWQSLLRNHIFLIEPSLWGETTVRIERMRISVLLSWEFCLGRREPYDGLSDALLLAIIKCIKYFATIRDSDLDFSDINLSRAGRDIVVQVQKFKSYYSQLSGLCMYLSNW